MHQDNRVDQGWSRWGGLLLFALVLLGWISPADAQQRYDLEDGDWVKQPVHEPGSPEGKLNAIRKLIAQGEGKKAKHAADDWIEAHEGHALLAEAYLIRGDANVARKHFFKSLYDYEYVIRQFMGSEQFHTAMEREFELAKLFAGGMNRRLWGMRILPATDEAEEILVRIQERSPGSELGEMASLMLADYYFDKPQMDSATEAYDLFLINYPRSERREWAMLRLIQANLARFKGPRFDATGLIDAGQRLKTYRAEYPSSAQRIGVGALLIRIDESLAMRDMVAADWHVKRKQSLSAIYLYQRVVTDYPQTAAALDAVAALEGMGAPVLALEEVSPPDFAPPEVVALPEVATELPLELPIEGPGEDAANEVSDTLTAPALEEAAVSDEALVEDLEAAVTERTNEIEAQPQTVTPVEAESMPEATEAQADHVEPESEVEPSQTQPTSASESEAQAPQTQPEKP